MDKYFSAQYLEHLRNPQNVLRTEAPDWEASGCGQMEGNRLRTQITFWVAVDENASHGPIQNLTWKAKGMPEAVAGASAISAHILENRLSALEAAALTSEEISVQLGGAPKHREDGILRALQALRRALFDAEALETQPHSKDQDIACHCMGLCFADLRVAALTEGDPLNLQRRTGFGTGCGTCLHMVHGYLDEIRGV